MEAHDLLSNAPSSAGISRVLAAALPSKAVRNPRLPSSLATACGARWHPCRPPAYPCRNNCLRAPGLTSKIEARPDIEWSCA